MSFLNVITSVMLFVIWISADIYDEARSKIEPLGMDTECVGGGRINHSSDKKNILVYGYSQVRNCDFEYLLVKALCWYI